jgi:peptidoglycan hydrolase-like protein with peptidoglycan-binding domain
VSSSDRVGRITTTGAITEYVLGPGLSVGPAGIVAGPDGALWFTESFSNKIGRITTAGTGCSVASPCIAEYSVRTSNSSPEKITPGPDGALWFTEYSGNKIGRITTAGVVTNEYPVLTPNAQPWGITAGPDGAVWFSEYIGNIGRIATNGVGCSRASPCIAEYFGPASLTMTAGPDGALWFADGNQIGQAIPSARRNGIDLSASADVPAPPVLSEFQQAGIQYVVIKAPQAGKWVGLARKQLATFSAKGSGFKTAAYCELTFAQTAASGGQQAQNCLTTIGTALGALSFVAVAVEGDTTPCTNCTTVICDAVQKLTSAGAKKVVIYTADDYWSALTAGATQCSPTSGGTLDFSSYPLWTAATAKFESYVDPAGNLACGFGTASLTPQKHCGNGMPSLAFNPFAAWTTQAGNQYDIGATPKCNETCLFGVKVDFDVFDPSLFP